MKRLLRTLRGPKAGNTPRPTQKRPELESLEDRYVPSTLSGFVYHDTNNNGVMNAGEAGLAGVTVTLTDSSNHSVSLKTQGDGSFNFTNQAAGTYSLRESTPSGYLDGSAAAGSLGGTAGHGTVSGIVLGP